MPGDENDGNVHAGVPQLLLKMQAANSGKAYVQYETTRTVRRHSL